MRESRDLPPQYKDTRAQEPGVQRGAWLVWYAGIDWANDYHDVLVIDEQGRQVGSLRVDHGPQGLSKLNTFLQQLIGSESKEQMACIIETTHGFLIAHLLEAGWPVYPVNPRTVDRRRATSGAKTDLIDAYLLAKTGRADLADLHRLTPDSENIAELKVLTRDQDALIQMQTRLVNQLTACLKAYYPVALELFSKLQQKSTLLFLQTLRRARHSNPIPVAAEIVERLHQSHLQADAVTTRTKSRLMQALVSQLLPLMEQIMLFCTCRAPVKQPSRPVGEVT
jgi:transposase